MNEPSSHEDHLLDEAAAAMRRMPAPERPPDELVLERLRQGDRRGLRSLSNTLYQRALRMHPLVRYGFVALVVSVLVLIGFGTRSETLLLADVMEAVSKHKSVRFESTNEPAAGPKGPQAARFNAKRPPIKRTTYSTLDRMHARIENSLGGFITIDRAKGVYLTVFPEEKRAVIQNFPGKQSTLGLLELIEELEKDKQTTSTEEQLEGHAAVAYRLTKDRVTSTIWADRNTKLPLRAEMEMLRGPRQKTTMSGFVWDPPVADPDKFYSVEPPAGYTVESKNLFKNAEEGKKTKQP
jgi:outer membrane lipoprotein-sorting protein